MAVSQTLSNVEFFDSSNGGMFDLNFSSGSFSVYGSDIGSSGTVTLGTFAVVLGNSFGPQVSTGTITVKTDVTSNGVPEPASLALLGAGLAGLAGLKRRKQAA